MAWFAAAAPYIAAAGTVISADQQRRAGEIDKMNADFQASQLERNANTAAAESQREAIKVRREAKYAESRARALAASSGGDASDPTVVHLINGIQDEGEYSALSALYNGNSQYGAMNTAAAVSRGTGKAAKNAGYARAGATTAAGLADFARSFTPPDEDPDGAPKRTRPRETVLRDSSSMARYG